MPNSANAVISTITNVLLNAVNSNGISAVQSIFQAASSIDSNLNTVINNVLNTISQYEGDLTETAAFDNIVSTLLLDSSSSNPIASSGGVDTYVTALGSVTQPSEAPLAYNGVDDLSNTGVSATTGMEPLRFFPGQYPYNKVYISESGHITETDDTPGFERLLKQHRAGTYEEIGPDGQRVVKVVTDNYHIVAKNDNIHIEGTAIVNIFGAARINIYNDTNIQVGGKVNLVAQEEIRIKGSEIYLESTSGDINILSAANTNIQSKTDMNLNAGAMLKTESAKDTNITSLANTNIETKMTQNIKADNLINIQSGKDTNINAGDNLNTQSGSDLNINSGAALNLQSSDDLNLNAGFDLNESADTIYLDSFVVANDIGRGDTNSAGSADSAGSAGTAIPADKANPTNIFIDPEVKRTSASSGGALGTGFLPDDQSFYAKAYLPDKAVIEYDDDGEAINKAIDSHHSNKQIPKDVYDTITTAQALPPSLSASVPSAPLNISRITSTGGVETGILNPTKKISKYFTIAHLTTGPALSHFPLKDQHGLTQSQIVANLSLLAKNCLDPIMDRYPNMFLTSAFRSKIEQYPTDTQVTEKMSQHEQGMAADIQFHGFNNAQVLSAAEWCVHNLPFDQVILERSPISNNYWLHISYGPKMRNMIMTCTNPAAKPATYEKNKLFIA